MTLKLFTALLDLEKVRMIRSGANIVRGNTRITLKESEVCRRWVMQERYEKCLRVSSSVKGKSLSVSPSGRKWTKS